ncbi:hypothetical protein M885DRAFT_551165 [Pelagophyceae sp. CCMP2097]|nr:hypothetical protein M885DRAFT_551165 [Pelagophyceae sp. CCMP2097]
MGFTCYRFPLFGTAVLVPHAVCESPAAQVAMAVFSSCRRVTSTYVPPRGPSCLSMTYALRLSTIRTASVFASIVPRRGANERMTGSSSTRPSRSRVCLTLPWPRLTMQSTICILSAPSCPQLSVEGAESSSRAAPAHNLSPRCKPARCFFDTPRRAGGPESVSFSAASRICASNWARNIWTSASSARAVGRPQSSAAASVAPSAVRSRSSSASRRRSPSASRGRSPSAVRRRRGGGTSVRQSCPICGASNSRRVPTSARRVPTSAWRNGRISARWRKEYSTNAEVCVVTTSLSESESHRLLVAGAAAHARPPPSPRRFVPNVLLFRLLLSFVFDSAGVPKLTAGAHDFDDISHAPSGRAVLAFKPRISEHLQ